MRTLRIVAPRPTYAAASITLAMLERSVVVPRPGEDETLIDVWVDGRLRELRVEGSMYQDGELIDGVDVTIECTPVDDADIEVPTDTLPR